MVRGAITIKRTVRVLVAALFTCLLILQGFGTIKEGASVALGDLGPAIATRGVGNCLGGVDHSSPIHQHQDGSVCCVWCAASTLDDSYLLATALIAIAAVLTPEPQAAVIAFPIDDIASPYRSGWGSSWTARAPPLT